MVDFGVLVGRWGHGCLTKMPPHSCSSWIVKVLKLGPFYDEADSAHSGQGWHSVVLTAKSLWQSAVCTGWARPSTERLSPDWGNQSCRPPSEPLKAFNLHEQLLTPLKRHFWPLMTFILMSVACFLSRCIFLCCMFSSLSFQNSKDVLLLQKWNLNYLNLNDWIPAL